MAALAAGAAGQTRTVPGVTTPVPLPGVDSLISQIASFGVGATQVDNHGNLLIFSTQYSYPNASATNLRLRVTPVPTTKITVVLSSGTVGSSREYPGATFQVVGTGQWGTYAILTTTTSRKLVAIDAGVTGTGLPALAANFASTDVASNVFHIDVVRARDGSADTLFTAPGSGAILMLAPIRGANSVVVYKYAGGSFSSTKVDLP